jgi:hypothetical protein
MWDGEWRRSTDQRQAKVFLKGQNKFLAALVLQKGTKLVGLVARMFTGHAFMKQHDRVILENTNKPVGDVTCRLCEDPDSVEDPIHIICQCPRLNSARNSMLGAFQLNPLVPQWNIKGMLEFIQLEVITDLEEC